MQIISRQDAISSGLKQYFTGKPCKHGHISPRKTCDHICLDCNRAKYKSWLSKNRERKNSADRDWSNKNKERHLEAARAWKKSNGEKNANIASEWRKNNRSHVIAYCAKRKALTMSATPKWADEAAILNIYESARLEKKQVDHIVPLRSRFVCGLHWHGNMQLLSKSENCAKKNYWWPDMSDTKDPELIAMVKEFEAKNE